MPLAIIVVPFFLADPPNMRPVILLRHSCSAGGIVVAFIQAQVLRILFRWMGPLDDDRRDGLLQQLGVMDVCAGHHHPQRAAVGLDDHTALGAIFPAIRGVGADLVPPKRALPIAPSALCHRQSTPPSSSQFSTSVAQRRSKTPWATHR